MLLKFEPSSEPLHISCSDIENCTEQVLIIGSAGTPYSGECFEFHMSMSL